VLEFLQRSGASLTTNISFLPPFCVTLKHDGTGQTGQVVNRDVNFVFFQKSIIVLKNSFFFDY